MSQTEQGSFAEDKCLALTALNSSRRLTPSRFIGGLFSSSSSSAMTSLNAPSTRCSRLVARAIHEDV